MKRQDSYPLLCRRLLERLIPENDRSDVLQAVETVYEQLYQEKGCRAAHLWIWLQLLKSLPSYGKFHVIWSITMLKNYLKIALRGVKRQKIFSFINIAGLAAGMACCLLIFHWIRDERSFDRFHTKIDRIFLLRCHIGSGSQRTTTSGSPPALGPALKADYPEVTQVARLMNWQQEFLMRWDGKPAKEKLQIADPSLFDVFTFPIVKGSREDIFSGPDVLVISETMAARHFGADNPIGKTVTIDNKFDFRVVGVMRDIPAQSTLRFDVWVPMELLIKLTNQPNFIDNWGNLAFRTYTVLEPGTSLDAFNAKIAGRVRQAIKDANTEPFAYPFKDYYLKLRKREKNVHMFSLVGGLILLLACINFTNLTTARSERRAREVGIRKVVGAERIQLVRQFLGESILYALLSMGLAFVLAAVLLPLFRTLTGKMLDIQDLLAGSSWLMILGMALGTGIISGIYPGFVLSSFRPVRTITGKTGSSERGGRLRKVLVVFQSGFSILLIICSLVFARQLHYMKTHDPGITKEHMLTLPVQGNLEKNYGPLKNELLRNPNIQAVTLTTDTPSYIGSYVSRCRWKGKELDYDPSVTLFGADSDFVKAFEGKVILGHFFSSETPPQSSHAVINEKLAGLMGMDSPVGEKIMTSGREFTIIGVVKNFTFRPLDQELESMIIFHDDRIMPYRYMFMRINPEDFPRTITFIEKLQKKFNPDYPFEYTFLDEEFDRMYKSEKRTGAVIQVFMVLAVLISSLGLFGLASFLAERKTKEIGIRRVLGASLTGLVFEMSHKFLKWILFANLLAWPAAYYFMSKWLQNYAFRINLSVWIFAASAGAALFIAAITVSFQAIKAALAPPTKSLRYE
ncbi:MAG: ABC transporter permease [Candidatus Aminicenantes bacterium]|nr:ABC transporter permease [Candidatus Aminicenantes bacterium]